MFAGSLDADGLLADVAGVRAELFGSLGATGHGHGSVKAVVLGLSGEQPETVDPSGAAPMVDRCREPAAGRCLAAGRSGSTSTRHHPAPPQAAGVSLQRHAVRGPRCGWRGARARARTTRSAAASCSARTRPAARLWCADPTPVPVPVRERGRAARASGRTGLPVSGVMLANELVRRDEAEVGVGPAGDLGGHAGVRRSAAARPRASCRAA